MSMVTLTCPTTGCEISSGIEVDDETLARLPLEIQVRCSACGQEHSWFTPAAAAREYAWNAECLAVKASTADWPEIQELWRTLQEAYLRMAAFEGVIEDMSALNQLRRPL